MGGYGLPLSLYKEKYMINWGGKKWGPPRPQRTQKINQSIEELLKPLGEKTFKGNVWGSVIMHVPESSTTTTTTVAPTPTPTATPTPTPSPTPTPTPSPTPTPTPTPTPAFDSDAATYLAAVVAAGGTTDSTISASTNTLFTTLKSNSLYTKLDVFWPMIGSTASSIALMGKRTSGTTYDLTWNGGFTYDSSGATGNGSNAYAKTNFLNNQTVLNDYSFGFYQFTENEPSKGEECIMGTYSRQPETLICSSNGPGNWSLRSGGNDLAQASNGGNVDGLYIANRTGSTNSQLYRNGSLTPILSVTNSYTETEDGMNIFIWNINLDNPGIPYDNGYANQGLNFVFIGRGLTSSDITNLSSIINTFQTSLGRNTY